MTYQMAYHPDILTFIAALSQDDQDEVKSLLAAIAESPEDGERVQSVFYREARGKPIYRRKTYSVTRAQFPKGLRIIYAVDGHSITILVMDIGDHQNSARHPGKSIYPDER